MGLRGVDFLGRILRVLCSRVGGVSREDIYLLVFRDFCR